MMVPPVRELDASFYGGSFSSGRRPRRSEIVPTVACSDPDTSYSHPRDAAGWDRWEWRSMRSAMATWTHHREYMANK